MIEILCNETERVAYLGPDGNFTHQIALIDQEARGYSRSCLVECSSIQQAFELLNQRRVGEVLAPIENFTDGLVTDTIQALQDYRALWIVRKYGLPVRMCGYHQLGFPLEAIYSKDTALRQCARNLAERFPNVRQKAVSSTGLAVRIASEQAGILGIGSEIAASAQNLNGLVQVLGLEDNPHNLTAFALITNRGKALRPTGDDETTFIMDIKDQKRGLLQALEALAARDFNLSKIKSLGRKEERRSFLTSVDAYLPKGSLEAMLFPVGVTQIKHLGSYPRPRYKLKGVGEPVLDFAKDQLLQEAKRAGISDQVYAVFTVPNRPGALARALKVFENINLSGVDSKMSGLPDQYVFYLSFPNDIDNKCQLVENLGQNCQRLLLVEDGSCHYVV